MDNRKESILTNDSLPITDGICKVSLVSNFVVKIK